MEEIYIGTKIVAAEPTDLDIRKEECRVKQLIAEMRFRFQLLQFQAELELFELKVQIWAATHRGKEVITDDSNGQDPNET